MTLHGKVVLITGASEGIGAACATSFRKRGARLALTARREDKLLQAARPDELAVPGDLTREDDRRRIVQNTLARFGAIDVLINNAGLGLYAPSWQAPSEQWRAMFELNLFALLEMTQLAVPGMRQRRSGTIVNVSSIAGKVALPWLTLYSASKYAVCGLTEGLRMELKSEGIHAMAVCPGYVDTHFQSHAFGGRAPQAIRKNRPFSITPEVCAEAIARGVERRARTVITPLSGWLLVAAAALFPRLVERQFERIRGMEQ